MKKSLVKGIALVALAAPVLGGCSQSEKPKEHVHDYVQHDAVAPTCETNGSKVYYTCSGCDELFDASKNKISSLDDVVDPALGHHWSTPEYKWAESEGSWKCTASRECDREGCDKAETETVDAVWTKTVDATCTTAELGQWVATFENKAFASQKRDLETKGDPLGHDFALIEKSGPTKVEYDAFEVFDASGFALAEQCQRMDCDEERDYQGQVTHEFLDAEGNIVTLTDEKLQANVVKVVFSTEYEEETREFAYDLEVSKLEVEIPEDESVEFDGSEKSYAIPSNDAYTANPQVITGIDVGSYISTLSLKDTTNYCWEDDSIEDKTVTLTISKAENQITIVDEPEEGKTCHTVTVEDLGSASASFGTPEAKVFDGEEEVTDLSTLEAGEYVVEWSVAGTDNYEGATAKTKIIVQHSYTEEVKDGDYLKTAGDCQNKAVFFKSCACGESSEGTEDEATFEGDYGDHIKQWVYNSETNKDELICVVEGCEEDPFETFDLTLNATGTQILDMSSDTIAPDVTLKNETGFTYKSIMLGDVSLGTDPAALDFSSIKTDVSKHGAGKTINVVVTKDQVDHSYSVPVDVVTKTIASVADLNKVVPTAANALTDYTGRQAGYKAVVGYYKQVADINYFPTKDEAAAKWDWNRVFNGTYDGGGHTIYSWSVDRASGAAIVGIFANVDGAKIMNLNVVDTYYKGWAGGTILAKAVFNTTLENVNFSLEGTREIPDTGKAEAARGWITSDVFYKNKITNCDINCEGMSMNYIFGRGANFSDANTFSGVTIKCNSMVALYNNNQKDFKVDDFDGITLVKPDAYVPFDSTLVSTIVDDCNNRWSKGMATSNCTIYEDNGQGKRFGLQISFNQYLSIFMPKVNFNNYEEVKFYVGAKLGQRNIQLPKNATDTYHQKNDCPYFGSTSSNDNTIQFVEISVKGGKIYQNGVELVEIFDANILNGTASLNFLMKGGSATNLANDHGRTFTQTQASLVYFSDMLCYGAKA